MLAPVQRSPWWICPRPNAAAALRLWCFPFAGGGAAIWFPWAARLGDTAELRAVRLPGRETRIGETPLTRLDPIVEALVPEIAARADEPYALCGHSLGGLIAFEVARRLRAQAAPAPAAFIVAGMRAPHLPPPQPLIHQLGARDFVDAVEERYGAIPEEIRADPNFLDLLLPPLRADMEIYETYAHFPAPPLDRPLLAMGGLGDAVVSRDDVLAWRQHTTAYFEPAFFEGGHFFAQENVTAVTARVRMFLAML